MKRSVLITILVVSSCVSTVAISAARAEEPPTRLSKPLYDLHDAATKANLTPTAKAKSFVTWMATNDWHSLNLSELYNLYGFINVDSLDRRHFSARWNGSLTAPATGTYTLRQMRQYSGTDSRLKVVIDGKTVLDSSDPSSGDNRFTSQPVKLTASQPVPIQVELAHDVSQIDVSKGAPMAVLTWKLGQANETIIPASAFTPPEDFGEAGTHGLKAEYFADTAFKDLKSTRLDPALDMVSTWPPLAPVHQSETSAVFDACKAKLMDDAYLTQMAANGGPDIVFRRMLWRIAYRMRAGDRQQLAKKLLNHPELVKGMTPGSMARVMQAFYMLPGKEHLTLVGEWALSRPQERYQFLPFPIVSTGATGAFENTLYDDYWRMGHVLQGPYWGDVEALSTKYFVRPNGECNLAVAYMTAYATREESLLRGERFVHTYTDRVQEALDDKTVAGDKRVSWLLARTFAEEILHSSHPLISPKSEFLGEARLVAESGDYKFWTLQEIAARHALMGEGEKLNATIGDFKGDTPDQQATITAWRDQASSIAAAREKEQDGQKQAGRTAYMNELKRRQEAATARGDNGAASRFGALISAAQASSEK